ncbi:hypothetical protein [Halopelagius longus]|uniref:Uncharacterized protein n=1 Tax=Halopelagius longus TaxID=1236180 RepID=A0A1H1GGC7_9EURY|nr:hypothetical protein [Halopelagius longus]RDI69604.1 hypothetical protein DWB78_17670 [Halopelagius longus]SDR12362.1 hypothetical protein SAMN05216278_3660 [Halopelagius longus]
MNGLEFGETTVAVGDDTVGRALVERFDRVHRTNADEADVTIEFRPGFVRPPDGCVEIHGGLWVDGDELFVDASGGSAAFGPFGEVLERIGRAGHQARIRGNPLREPVEVTVFYDDRVVDSDHRMLRQLVRSYDKNYASRPEVVAVKLVDDIVEAVLHQRLLARGSGLLHASGVVRDGDAALFSGWSGVGKSDVSGELVREHGYDLLGDDLVLVSEDGTASPYRKRMRASPRSIADGEATYDEVMNGRGLLDRGQWRVRERIGGPTAVRRNVLPSVLDGHSADVGHLSESPVATVVNLVVEDRETIGVEWTTPDDIAERGASTVMSELEPFTGEMRAVHAAAPTRWPDPRTVAERSDQIYRRALADAETYVVSVPPEVSGSRLADELSNRVLSDAN